MKKILLLILLTLGLYPVIDHGKLHMGVTRTMADSWGDEGWGDEDEDWNDEAIYDSMSEVFGMDIVGSSEWMGHTVITRQFYHNAMLPHLVWKSNHANYL